MRLRHDITVSSPGELSTVHVAEIQEGANAWVDTIATYFTLQKSSGLSGGQNVIVPLSGSPNAGAALARWVRSSQAAGEEAGVFVYRPGGVPSATVYPVWSDLYAALLAFDGPRVVQIDDSIVSPAVVPAGVYDLANTTLQGVFGNVPTQCFLLDGVQFPHLSQVTGNLTMTSLSTTLPVLTLGNNDILVLELGAVLQSDPASTVPAIAVVPGTSPIIVQTLGGTLGSTGNHVLSIGLGAAVILAEDTLASLPTDVITGPGTALVVVLSSSMFLNTPNPITQPAVGTLVVVFAIFAFAESITVNPADWVAPPPTDVQTAINRQAALLVVLNGGPIP